MCLHQATGAGVTHKYTHLAVKRTRFGRTHVKSLTNAAHQPTSSRTGEHLSLGIHTTTQRARILHTVHAPVMSTERSMRL